MATMAIAPGLESPPHSIPQGLRLEPESHIYTYNGQRVPGVTDSLKRAGLIDFSGIPQHVLDRAAERGRAVHLALDYLDRGTLDRDSISDELQPYLRAYESFCLDTGFVCGLAERSRYQAQYGYAGTFDRTGMLGDDAVVLDFKSGAVQAGHFCQLAAYTHFFPNARRFRPIGLQLSAEGRYKVHEVPVCRFEYYWTSFRSALNCAHFAMAEGRA